MNAKKVLIFPAGSEIAFEIVNALKYSKFVEIYGATSTDDHSAFIYKRLIKDLPQVNDINFIEKLNDVIAKYDIDCVYPAHDSASVVLSEHRNEIKAQVIITDTKTTVLCRSKKDTYTFFKESDFVPAFYEHVEDIKAYPVFVKPSVGQGSQGARLVYNENELTKLLHEDFSLVICEYLPGMEYTIDCFTDKNGKLLVTKFRDRQRIKAGISVRSQEYATPQRIIEIATEINKKLSFKGAWFFQVKKDTNDHYKLLEISPRIPGTMGISRNMGINFPLLTLFTYWDYDVDIIDNAYGIVVDRAFYNAYQIAYEFSHIYIDFDDTLILGEYVNSEAMKFLYQEKNSGKTIHLLSKHRGDLLKDMARHAIPKELFDEIIVIAHDDEKFKYLRYHDAIFIDDSFAERKAVHDKTGIPVFDVDMIESLIDWRY